MAAYEPAMSSSRDNNNPMLNIPVENRGLVLRPLVFPEDSDVDLDYGMVDPRLDVPLFCLACESQFNEPLTAKDRLLEHLLVKHKIVIGKVNLVCSMKRYTSYWKRRLKDHPWTEFMVVVRNRATPSEDSPGEDYYLLGDALMEDRELRQELHMDRLRMVILIQEKERKDTSFNRMCLFCSQVFTGNRSSLFVHMLEQHNFNIGHCDNVVFVDEFLDGLEKKLDELQCLFCEKTFKDRPILKDHMRKKQHRKLDPANKEYDKYYIVNYLEFGKTWRELADEDDYEVVARPSQDDREWSNRGDEGPPLHCLFCGVVTREWSNIEEHMKTHHHFTLSASPEGVKLDFYLKVKVINYIRRQIHFQTCCYCAEKFECETTLREHMEKENHCRLPNDASLWDQSQYLFSTYENDSLLYYLEESDEDSSEIPNKEVNAQEKTRESLQCSTEPEETRIEQLLLGGVLKDIEGD